MSNQQRHNGSQYIDDELKANPRLPAIDGAWNKIRSYLSCGQGRNYVDLMLRLRDEDRGVWNALYWRTSDWFGSWFESRKVDTSGMSHGEARAAGMQAFHSWLWRLYKNRPDPVAFKTEDVAYILQELDKETV